MIEKVTLPLAAFVAENATVRGHVSAGKGSSIYFGAVIRSETEEITIGENTNIQDNCVLHTDAGFPISIGRGCTIGHTAILHGCTIGENTLIGGWNDCFGGENIPISVKNTPIGGENAPDGGENAPVGGGESRSGALLFFELFGTDCR